MKFKLSAVASDSENRGSDLMDLAHWLNGDHEPVDPPEGLLPPPQMTCGIPITIHVPGFRVQTRQESACVADGTLRQGSSSFRNQCAVNSKPVHPNTYFIVRHGTLCFGVCDVTQSVQIAVDYVNGTVLTNDGGWMGQ